jgi:RNA polymerase sigma-70 factor, ECF subfamily
VDSVMRAGLGISAIDGLSVQARAARHHRHHLDAVVEAGDASAFGALFNYYAPRVRTYVRRLGASDDLAEELSQEVMLTVWRKAATYDPAKAAVNTWIFSLARHLRIDALRREQLPQIDASDPTFAPDPVPTPESLANSAQVQARLHAALDQLPREQLLVVGLAFYEGKSHGEIADQLSIPLGTVKSRLRLAYQRIRFHLESRRRLITRAG